MNVKYEDEEIEEDKCKCGGDRMYQQTEKENEDGFILWRIRCTGCNKTEKGKFDAHLGCVHWPNCDIGGCGYHHDS